MTSPAFASPIRHRSPVVLIVDDDVGVLSAGKMVIERTLEADVDALSDPALVASRCAARAYDVALFDVDMPGIDGFELALQLRAAGHRFPVLFWTGRLPTPTLPPSLAASRVLLKPVDGDTLVAVLRELLGSPGS